MEKRGEENLILEDERIRQGTIEELASTLHREGALKRNEGRSAAYFCPVIMTGEGLTSGICGVFNMPSYESLVARGYKGTKDDACEERIAAYANLLKRMKEHSLSWESEEEDPKMPGASTLDFQPQY